MIRKPKFTHQVSSSLAAVIFVFITAANISAAQAADFSEDLIIAPQAPGAETVTFTLEAQSGAEDVNILTVTALLDSLATDPVTVTLEVSGTAALGSLLDYTLSTAEIVIPTGQVSGALTVTINDDHLDEDDETIIVQMAAATNASPTGTTTHTITILDNDEPPTVNFSAGSQSVNENTGALIVQAELSVVSGKAITVPLNVSGTANAGAGADYTLSGAQISIPAGSLNGPLTITIDDDSLDEDDETVVLEMGAVINASQGITNTHTLTILDDESPPEVNFSAASQPASENAGTLTVQAALSAASSKAVTVPLSVSGTAAGAGVDYTLSSSQISIPAGSLSSPITITINDDSLDEDDETVILEMGAVTNATPGITTTHAVTILDNESPPEVNFNTAGRLAGENAGTLTVQATLSAVSGKAVTVPLNVSGTATAEAGADYTLSGNQISIPAGSLSSPITITINDDSLDEDNETIIISMGGVNNATPGSTDTHTIALLDNDPSPSLSIDDAILEEGNTGTSDMVFTVSLSAASSHVVQVNYTTGDETAHAPDDYDSLNGQLNFSPGETTHTIRVKIKGDTLDENDEDFFIALSLPTHASLADNQAVGTIIDDDASPGISIHDTSTIEGEAGNPSAVFTVTLSFESARLVMVEFTTSDGTAQTPEDYASQSGTITFNPGELVKTIQVPVIDDTRAEDDETFWVDLTNSANAPITDGRAAGIIQDNDTAGITIQPSNNLLTKETGDQIILSVKLDSQPDDDVTVHFASSDPSEGSVSPASLIFTPAQWNSVQTVALSGEDDQIADGNISYQVQVSTTSSDGRYNELQVPSISAINIDNDSPGITVNPTTSLTTNEAGLVAELIVVLNTLPAGPVILPISSSNPNEGIIDREVITFTGDNWNIPQTIVLTGVNDDLDDGDIAYWIMIGPALSSDELYNGLDPEDVQATNHDDDGPALAWISPVANSQPIFIDGDQHELLLRIEPQSDSPIQSLRFYRWDAPNERHVQIGVITQAPWEWLLDCRELNFKWNQVFVVAYDPEGHASVEQPYIFIYRRPFYQVFLPEILKH